MQSFNIDTLPLKIRFDFVVDNFSFQYHVRKGTQELELVQQIFLAQFHVSSLVTQIVVIILIYNSPNTDNLLIRNAN